MVRVRLHPCLDRGRDAAGRLGDPRLVFDLGDWDPLLDVGLKHSVNEIFTLLGHVFRPGESHFPFRLVADHFLDV